MASSTVPSTTESAPTVLILPGWHSSGPGHWQSLWEAGSPAFVRVEQRDWATPVLADWVDTLEAYVARHAPVVLVAHSLACVTVAHWARAGEKRVRGALLVAPADPERAGFPPELAGFGPAPRAPLPFPGVLVASRSDPYCAFDRAADLADAWGLRLHDAGDVGHLNVASGHGPWQGGEQLLASLPNLDAETVKFP